jgi:CheY-like chemotaxis protein
MQQAKRQTRTAPTRRGSRDSLRHGTRDAIENEISELVPVAYMGRSVLVVEADPEIQARLARWLSRRGNRVVGTGSGDGALALLSRWSVELVFISETLPGRSGVDVARLIHQRCPRATIVILSDNIEPAIRLAARAAGAADCVRKPSSDEELGQLLRARITLHEREAVAQ